MSGLEHTENLGFLETSVIPIDSIQVEKFVGCVRRIFSLVSDKKFA